MERAILAVDHGTSGVKTSLVTVRGEVVDTVFEPTHTTFLSGGGAEQDPEEWWRALVSTSRQLFDRGLIAPEAIEAVCVSSTFSTTVAVGSDGRHLSPALSWMDSRGAPYVREIVGGRPRIDGYGVFSILPWIRKTGGGPSLSGKDDIAHVLWWMNERPEIYGRARYFMGSKDYLNLRLTGEAAASFDSMTLFWLTNTRNIDAPFYDDRLVAKIGIDKVKLPEMKRSIDVLGTLTPDVADELGLGQDVKVVIGSPDHQSACIGSGAVRDFEGHLYVGTSSWIQCVVPFKKTDLLHSIASLPTSIPGKYYAANEQDTAGGVLSFLVDNLLYHSSELRAEPPPDDVYERLDRIAAGVAPGANGVVVTPWLHGERTPVDDTTTRAGIYNLSMATNLDHVVRAFFEGVALNARWSLEYVERFVGRRLDSLAIVGGGATSAVWCQIFADVLDRTIRQTESPLQANARGAALIASVALGHIGWDDIPDLVPIARVFEPSSANRALYDELFEVYLQIYRRNRGVFRRLKRIGDSTRPLGAEM